jgi:hypothetical protein
MYYSKTRGNLPINYLKLTERRPCFLSNSFISPKNKNHPITRDKFGSRCSYGAMEELSSNSFQLTSKDVTVTENEFLEYIGAYKRLRDLKDSPKFDKTKSLNDYVAAKKDIQLYLW